NSGNQQHHKLKRSQMSSPSVGMKSNQRKRRDRSHVQSVDSSHMSEGQCDSDVRKSFKKTILVKKSKQSPNEKSISSVKSGESSRIVNNLFVYTKNESDDRLYVCSESLGYWSKFKTYMRAHSGEKHFLCEECNKSFNCLSHLKRHVRTHTGEKPFSCKECKKTFNLRSNLKTHMRTHTGEKPFSCKECDKGFSRVSHLKTHMRTHTGEKPFLCKECDTRFSSIFSLKRHIRNHTEGKRFSCKECNKRFNLKKNKKIYNCFEEKDETPY
uniref:C2H2-type domain-containing protein n=1 Tax=Oryzias sinensis TaxID=183150 RepID=A0A8C7XY65_9TELE